MPKQIRQITGNEQVNFDQGGCLQLFKTFIIRLFFLDHPALLSLLPLVASFIQIVLETQVLKAGILRVSNMDLPPGFLDNLAERSKLRATGLIPTTILVLPGI